jgi:hypothetical protein
MYAGKGEGGVGDEEFFSFVNIMWLLAIVGITISLIATVIGLILFLVTLVQWIRAATHEISELPAEHRAAH